VSARAEDRPTVAGEPLLRFQDVHTYYGPLHVLKGVSYEIYEGEIVSLLGGNASGKSTTMKTVLGLVRPAPGIVTFRGEPIHTLRTSEIVRRGIAPVPEARRVFPRMTVLENLELGAFARRDREAIAPDLDRVMTLFPRLRERIAQQGGTLSGGEQQMLALARALLARPRLLLLDEPSLGLAPIIVGDIFRIVAALNEQDGLTVLVVEQNARIALRHAARAYVLEVGRVALEGAADELERNESVRKSYLGY
jgi:branched-chain amino acid transport system ATP-binding protein